MRKSGFWEYFTAISAKSNKFPVKFIYIYGMFVLLSTDKKFHEGYDSLKVFKIMAFKN